jgi:hypothetical protein
MPKAAGLWVQVQPLAGEGRQLLLMDTSVHNK